MLKLYVNDFNDYAECMQLSNDDGRVSVEIDLSGCYDDEAEEWNDYKVRETAEAEVERLFCGSAKIVWGCDAETDAKRESKECDSINCFELVVVFCDGEKAVYLYPTAESAEYGGENMKMALGNQVEWYGVRQRML